MPFCRNCGSPVDGQFCAKCGTPMAAAAAPPPQAPPAQPYAAPPPPAQPYAPQPAPAASGMSDNVAGLLCYVLGFITGILFLVIEPYNKSKFVRFHAFQSILLNVAWFAIWIVLSILTSILFAVLHMFLFVTLIGLLHMLVGLAFFILWILMMIKAYQGQKFMLPIIGAIADKQA
jgi:uncharacterized membrane protein